MNEGKKVKIIVKTEIERERERNKVTKTAGRILFVVVVADDVLFDRKR